MKASCWNETSFRIVTAGKFVHLLMDIAFLNDSKTQGWDIRGSMWWSHTGNFSEDAEGVRNVKKSGTFEDVQNSGEKYRELLEGDEGARGLEIGKFWKDTEGVWWFSKREEAIEKSKEVPMIENLEWMIKTAYSMQRNSANRKCHIHFRSSSCIPSWLWNDTEINRKTSKWF